MTEKKNPLWRLVEMLESGFSLAEFAWKLTTIVFVVGGGTLSALVAKSDPVLRQLGWIYWIAIGLLTSLTIALIFYFVRAAGAKAARADLYRSWATPRGTLNPLMDSFKDVVIPPEDMRLPGAQVHEKKHFKNCKFVGPGAMAIMGGTVTGNTFKEQGDMIAVPDGTRITGVVIFRDCTFHQCEFFSITLLLNQATGRSFRSSGASVKGLV